jgi:hypothetical protein
VALPRANAGFVHDAQCELQCVWCSALLNWGYRTSLSAVHQVAATKPDFVNDDDARWYRESYYVGSQKKLILLGRPKQRALVRITQYLLCILVLDVALEGVACYIMEFTIRTHLLRTYLLGHLAFPHCSEIIFSNLFQSSSAHTQG